MQSIAKLIYLIFLAGLILLTSCHTSDPETIAQKEIRDILYDVSLDFNLDNITGIMDHVHSEYLHKGMISYHLNDLWLDRMAQFSLLEIEVLYIEFEGDKAVVHSNNKFSSAIESVTLHEPEDSGDISYFIRENGVWLIYGNQMWAKGIPEFSRKGNLLVAKTSR
jgi:hypothetical protein